MGPSAAVIHHRHPDLISRISSQHEMPKMTLELLLSEFDGQTVFMSRAIDKTD